MKMILYYAFLGGVIGICLGGWPGMIACACIGAAIGCSIDDA